MERRNRGFIVGADGRISSWNSICGKESGQEARIEVIVPERFSRRVEQLLSYERKTDTAALSDTICIQDFIEMGGKHQKSSFSKKRPAARPNYNIKNWTTASGSSSRKY